MIMILKIQTTFRQSPLGKRQPFGNPRGLRGKSTDRLSAPAAGWCAASRWPQVACGPQPASLSISLSLSLYMYIYIYIYIHTHTYAYIHICIHMCIHVYVYIYTYT